MYFLFHFDLLTLFCATYFDLVLAQGKRRGWVKLPLTPTPPTFLIGGFGHMIFDDASRKFLIIDQF